MIGDRWWVMGDVCGKRSSRWKSEKQTGVVIYQLNFGTPLPLTRHTCGCRHNESEVWNVNLTAYCSLFFFCAGPSRIRNSAHRRGYFQIYRHYLVVHSCGQRDPDQRIPGKYKIGDGMATHDQTVQISSASCIESGSGPSRCGTSAIVR